MPPGNVFHIYTGVGPPSEFMIITVHHHIKFQYLHQAFVNIGMNIGLMPVTGITLPFVSSGLSSLWAFLIAEGILQSILIRRRKLAFQPD